MHQAGKSVLYVHPINGKVDFGSLSRAQRFAFKYALPLAVVTVLEVTGRNEQIMQLEELQPIEKQLAHFNIPVIVLIGSTQTVLEGFKHHTKPKQLFIPDDVVPATTPQLQIHPYTWPGTVIPVKGIMKLVTSDKITC
jgi:hypothetical protein